MALKVADRVRQTSNTTGTGTLSLIAPATGDVAFSLAAAIGSGNTTYYVIEDTVGNWEIGIGTVTAGSPDTLSRDTVVRSSAVANALVNFAAGTKTVVCDIPASKRMWSDTAFANGDVPVFDGTKFAKPSNPVSLGSTSGVNRIDAAGSTGLLFRFLDSSGGIEGILVSKINLNTGSLINGALGTASAGGAFSWDNSEFFSIADNVRSLGTAALRFSVVYAGTGSINTSDEAEKQWRGALTDAEFAAGKAIFSEIGGFKFLDAIAAKGEDVARLHVGVRAQKVRDILSGHSLDPLSYAFLCYDEWPAIAAVEAVPEVMDEAGQIITAAAPAVEPRPAGSRWGIRPDELAYFLLAVLDRRLSALEAA